MGFLAVSGTMLNGLSELRMKLPFSDGFLVHLQVLEIECHEPFTSVFLICYVPFRECDKASFSGLPAPLRALLRLGNLPFAFLGAGQVVRPFLSSFRVTPRELSRGKCWGGIKRRQKEQTWSSPRGDKGLMSL